LEGLITRVGASRYREDFVLKGGVLLAAFSLRRPTKDVDLQATGIANDPTTVLTRVIDIAAIDIDDGLNFDEQPITAQPIRNVWLSEIPGCSPQADDRTPKDA